MNPFFDPFGMLAHAATAWSDAGRRMAEATTACWSGAAFGSQQPARSWYRPPTPQLPGWPMAQMFAMPSINTFSGWANAWPMPTWPSAAPSIPSVYNPMAFWSAFTPFATTTLPQSWNVAGFAPQSLMAGPLTKACATFWFEMMREGMAAATSPGAMAAVAENNPFAAYRSNGGHAVAQITFADNGARPAYGLFDPFWMATAFAPFGSSRVH